MTSPGLSTATNSSDAPASATSSPSTAAMLRLPRAHLVVTSAHGVVEVERDGARYVGVLDAPGATVSVGGALALKILCRAENAYPYVVEDPQDLTVHVIAIDDADIVGTRQMLQPGVGLDVAVSTCVMHSALAPPLPVVVGASLDDALNNAVLADTLEPDAHDEHAADEDVITGSLRRLPLAELVQALSFAKKTASIHVRIPSGNGVVHLDDGEITCAQLDDDPRRAVLRGAPAFYRLLAHDDGTFRVSFEREWHERNVRASTQALLLDGLRLIDEARRDRATAPDHDAVAHEAALEPELDVELDVELEVELDDAFIDEITFACDCDREVRPAMVAHLASPVVPLRPVPPVAARSSSKRRLPPVLSSVLAAPRSSTR